MDIHKTRNFLLAAFWSPIIVCLAIIIPYENDWLLAGALAGDKVAEYYVATVMELLTICLIPLSLRLFKFKAVRKALTADAATALRRWGMLRMAMLTIPMMVNCVLYYQFMNVAFGYMGIIGLLCLVFVFPSKTRCESETANEPDDTNA